MTEPQFVFQTALDSEEKTEQMARDLAPHMRQGDLLILSGGLGAGKTFFVRALCYALGLDEDERVVSPTFALALNYPTTPPLIHADLYRLGGEDDVFELGLDVQRAQGDILVVEWGAPYEAVLGGDALHLDFEIDPRTLTIHGSSDRAQEVVSKLAVLGRGVRLKGHPQVSGIAGAVDE